MLAIFGVLALLAVLPPCVERSAHPRDEEALDPCSFVIARAWVDPVLGHDMPTVTTIPPQPQTSPSPQINNPLLPFRTLQAAIDQVFIAQELLWQPNQQPTSGIVYALPGIYGPTGSGDVFPIIMRDRVNVQGLGAQGCVLREVSPNNVPALPTSPPAINFFLPVRTLPINLPTINGVVVLVDFGRASQQGPSLLTAGSNPPWVLEPDSFEMLDAFTFEGGDIQIMFWIQLALGFTPKPTHARITNCIFDMRHGWFPKDGVLIDGPFLGIELAKRHTPITGPGGIRGYPEQFVMIAHNTFIMGSPNFELQGDPWIRCREGAVGVIDVIDPACQLQVSDIQSGLRGVGTPGVFNNIFRTAPGFLSAVQPMAMLGIDSSDTKMFDAVSGTIKETNAFDPQRNGSSTTPPFDNGWFTSVPMVPTYIGSAIGLDLFNSGNPGPNTPPNVCAGTMPAGSTVAAAPTPNVALFDGNAGVDPCFVGEYLNDQNLVLPLPGGIRYHDWRLLPGSPMANKGVAPFPATTTSGPTYCTAIPSLSCFSLPLCPLLRSTDWDCEEYGNPRTVDGIPDLGADETHGYVCAGSYGNDSKSHNVPPTGLAPNTAPGRATRYLILRSSAQQQSIVIHGKATLPPVPTPVSGPPAWTQPPGTLTPALRGPSSLPADSRSQWITFSDPSPPGAPDPTPTPWQSVANPQTTQYVPTWMIASGQLAISFCTRTQPDNELVLAPPVAPVGFGTYFASQLVMHTIANVQVYWSNLQAEYR